MNMHGNIDDHMTEKEDTVTHNRLKHKAGSVVQDNELFTRFLDFAKFVRSPFFMTGNRRIMLV